MNDVEQEKVVRELRQENALLRAALEAALTDLEGCIEAPENHLTIEPIRTVLYGGTKP